MPPSFAALAIWLMFRPIEASSPMLRFSASSSSFGRGMSWRRCARVRTERKLPVAFPEPPPALRAVAGPHPESAHTPA